MSSTASASPLAPLHMIDLIRKKRDCGSLDAREIGFLVTGAANESIPNDQLAAWLMAAMPSLSILAILLWLGFSAHLAADVELADAETAQQLP